MKGNYLKYIKIFLALIIISAFYLLVGCPIRYFTGICCPGCGMTRAWFNVLQLNFIDAFYYHPLWIIPLIYIVLYIAKLKNNRKLNNIVLLIIVFLFFAVYIYRLYTGGNIVYIDLNSGFIYKFINQIIN